jgi:hypothetical protein
MSPSPLHPFFHVGIVVADLSAAQAQLSEQLGVTWGPVLHLDETEVRDGEGQDLVLPSTICYSVEEPRLELIQEVPGSVWACNEHSNLHHLGFWSDDLAGDSLRLTGAACPLQLSGRVGESAPEQFAYHRGELGVRLEILDAALQPMLGFLFEPPI